MNREIFLNEVEAKLNALFKASKRSHKLPSSVKYRCEGFMEAGIFLKLASRQELNQLMEQVHFDVFSKTIAQAKQEKSKLWSNESIDYSIYEVPPGARSVLMKK